ncbi:MAG: hypothetical protein ACTSRG_23145 [Candidatus Helarchaeota archaeon]
MRYEDLFKLADLYQKGPKGKKWNEKYQNIIKKEALWRKFKNREHAKEILKFLNSWGCRIQESDELLNAICRTFKESEPFLNAFKGEKLENMDLKKIKKMNNEQSMECGTIILFLYSKFSNIGFKFRHTAASKLLHLLQRELFVIWDKNIWEYYWKHFFKKHNVTHERNAYNYTYFFIPRMKEEINNAINTYMNFNKCTRDAAILDITSKYDET